MREAIMTAFGAYLFLGATFGVLAFIYICVNRHRWMK